MCALLRNMSMKIEFPLFFSSPQTAFLPMLRKKKKKQNTKNRKKENYLTFTSQACYLLRHNYAILENHIRHPLKRILHYSTPSKNANEISTLSSIYERHINSTFKAFPQYSKHASLFNFLCYMVKYQIWN